MTRQAVPRALFSGALLIVALAAGVAVVRVLQHRGDGTHQAASVYYCPMHPTYTSTRPGDCPICNMKLVKREDSSEQQAASSKQQKKEIKDICYLHNCPMVHQGKPCPMLVVAKAGEKVTCPLCGTHVVEAAEKSEAKKILYWTDPMIPGYKSDKPGKSPMGMDLIPVYEEEPMGSSDRTATPEGYAPILVTPQKRQLIGVTTASVARRTLTKTIRTVGRIAYDPELYQAQQEYLQALNALLRAHTAENPQVLKQAEDLVASTQLRLRLLGLSDALIQEMTGWSEPDRRLLLAGPSGEAWLYAPVYEFELPLVRVGQTVMVDNPSLPGKTLQGTIKAIDPVLDPATRSARVRAIVRDAEGLLKPEMYVNASVVFTAGEAMAVPEEAVFHTGTRQILFVDKGQGVFEPREVMVGIQADGYTEIKDGVAEGEVVVTSGNFLIDSESRLKAALQGAGGLPAAPEQEQQDATQAGGAHHHGP